MIFCEATGKEGIFFGLYNRSSKSLLLLIILFMISVLYFSTPVAFSEQLREASIPKIILDTIRQG